MPETDEWATLDALLGVEVVDLCSSVLGGVAFYGRCSTEDNQDPQTSRGWQLGNASKFVEPFGGRIVAEYFDIGQSRSVPWDRRVEGSRLLQVLKNPDRGFGAVVVGEGTRCWFGNQFSLIAPRFAAHGVELWVPELGGRFDARNPSHKMLMSVLGGMSESERQHVQARVRAAMDAQVVNEGRHQGGRAPYGYVVVDAGPHPNPRKSAEGYRLRVLALDDTTADVVARIFSEYLDTKGDRAIATELNREGIPCPSARWPDQNRHRLGDGWQGSTVRAILENPRYRLCRVRSVEQARDAPQPRRRWGWPRRSVPQGCEGVRGSVPATSASGDRVGCGLHPGAASPPATRIRWSPRPAQARARSQGHQARIPLQGSSPLQHLPEAYGRHASAEPDLLPLRCRSITPGSPILQNHPKNVYLPERVLITPVNDWLGSLFDEEHRAQTAALLAGTANPTGPDVHAEHARKRLNTAETHMRRLQEAIKAGANPVALVDAINQAHEEATAARALLDGLPKASIISQADVEALVDHLGGLSSALSRARPDHLASLYRDVGLAMVYDPDDNALDVTIRPPLVGVVNVSEGGLEPPRPLIGH